LAGGREVNVLVENRPGAGGRVAYEYVFNAEPDGTRMVLLGDQGAALQQVALGANFALDRFTYLAQVNQSDWGILIRTNTGIKDMNDLIRRAQQKPILVGTSGVGSGDHIASTIVQSILQKNGVSYPLQFVHFKGSKPVFASMQREEAELYIGSVESTLPATKEDYARIIVVFTRERNVYFPDTSTVFEQKIPGAEEMAENLGITRVLVGPPGIPADRVNVLREGLRMAMNDPELLEAARTAKLPVNYGGPEEGKASVRGHSGGVLNYKDVVLKAMEGK
jgi:tripartite-type tricarboxylate transporter receptor subunit TctC